MSFQFEFFRNNWLTYSEILNPFAPSVTSSFTLDDDFFNSLKFDQSSLKNYRIDAAKAASSVLGDRPALCFSGGIDSQAMILAFLEAGVECEVFLMRFGKEFNSMDTEHAIMFANNHNIKLNIFDIDVVRYLTHDLYNDAEIYKCSSPHFLTHYKLYDYIRAHNCTGLASAGNVFSKFTNGWEAAPSAPQLNYINYTAVNDFPVIGSFLLYDPYVCWTLGLLTPAADISSIIEPNANHAYLAAQRARYVAKVKGYRNAGLDVIPQETKYTGFEKLKEFFAQRFSDGWAFENQFRHPLENRYGKSGSNLLLTDSQLNAINELHAKNFTSS